MDETFEFVSKSVDTLPLEEVRKLRGLLQKCIDKCDEKINNHKEIH